MLVVNTCRQGGKEQCFDHSVEELNVVMHDQVNAGKSYLNVAT